MFHSDISWPRHEPVSRIQVESLKLAFSFSQLSLTWDPSGTVFGLLNPKSLVRWHKAWFLKQSPDIFECFKLGPLYFFQFMDQDAPLKPRHITLGDPAGKVSTNSEIYSSECILFSWSVSYLVAVDLFSEPLKIYFSQHIIVYLVFLLGSEGVEFSSLSYCWYCSQINS